MNASPQSLQLAYFGDDFTGSTDALESLTRAGLRTVLFLAPPTARQLARFPALDAVGVAGLTRALAPDAMDTELRPALAALRALRPRHVQYKVCSTFDSSPEVGSIGCAIDIGLEVFQAPFVPLVVGAPALGRFCIFGNLFAQFGIGSAGAIHRLDRHPSISRHPVTPMVEADLRLHLAKQTHRRIGLIDVLALNRGLPETGAALAALIDTHAEIVLFDVLLPEHLERIGALIDPLGTHDRPLFSVGSSALASALAAQWTRGGAGTQTAPGFPSPGPAEPLLVVSGSCSPVTARQIEHALERGFAGISLSPDASNETEATTVALAALRAGRHAVVYSSRSNHAEALKPAPASVLGSALGRIARTAVEQVGVHRVLLAGGDSSSYAARALGIEAVEMISPLAPGAPLCRAHAPGTAVDGLEVNVKGGQVGTDNYFEAVVNGSL